MTTARASRPATRRDLAALPANVVGEILGGELHVSPRPASPHAVASSVMGALLTSHFHGRDDGGGGGGWWILDEPELELGEDIIVPDLAGWRRARVPVLPDVAAFTLVPDWVCEVLSPSTVRVDRLKKVPLYFRAGVAHLWLVDAAAQLIEVFRRGSHNWEPVITVGDDVARLEPFEALELDLKRLWDRGEPAG